MSSPRTLAALAALCGPALAQTPLAHEEIVQSPGQAAGIVSPGMPPGAQLGQTTQFTNEFNPAIGLVFDIIGSYTDSDEARDGFELSLRSLELTGAAYVDPNAWAYAVISGDIDEGLQIEEAAVRYLGLPGNHTLQAGRFFVDFGKQMQAHVHDLRTIDRPAVLREYLGTELAGTGLQYDNWFPVGDKTVLRYSVGVFQGLVGEGHAHGEDEAEEIEIHVERRVRASELAWTGRVTGLRDVGERGVLQLGASARWQPSFAYEADGFEEVDDNETWVWGADLTYGWRDPRGGKSWTVGGEYLVLDGDIRPELDTITNQIVVEDDTVHGFYVFLDHGMTPRDHIGVQWSRVELPEEAGEEIDEYDLYYTRFLTEFQRLRLAVTFREDQTLGDETRFAIQYTNYIGPHAHGINW